jgi:hypothetical protein
MWRIALTRSFVLLSDEEANRMRLAFSAAWKYLQSSESVSEPGLREKLACKIIELARDVSPDVDVLRDAALRSLGHIYDGSHCRLAQRPTASPHHVGK